MDFSKKGFRAGLVCAVILIFLSLINLIPFGFHAPGLILSCVVFNAIYVGWGFSVFRRFPQRRMRGCMAMVVVAFVMLGLLRTAKYAYVVWDGVLARHLWYAYYIPIIFGSLLMFRAALHLGKPDDYKASSRWNWLYLPAFLLVCAIMTNDLHSLCFRFAPDFMDWYTQYTYGPLYFTVIVWIALMSLGAIALAVKSTINRRLLKTAWLPLLVLTVCVINGLGYVSGRADGLVQLSVVGFPDYVCLCTIIFWECLVTARIVTSNNGYPAVFAASSLNAGLADIDYKVRHMSAKAVHPLPQELEAARNNELLLPDGDTLLKVRPVQGGWFYWTEDVSELRRLNEALDHAAEELAEENHMLRAAAEMEESRRVTAAKIRLYDSVNESLRPQLELMNEWMDDLPTDEAAFCGVLQRMGVLLAYCKRRSGLLLQADTHPVVTGEELQLCFLESAKALSMCGITCEVEVEPSLQIAVKNAAMVYEAFESVLEKVLLMLKQVAVDLSFASNGKTDFGLTIRLLPDEETQQTIERLRLATDHARTNLEPAGVNFVFVVKDCGSGGASLCV